MVILQNENIMKYAGKRIYAIVTLLLTIMISYFLFLNYSAITKNLQQHFEYFFNETTKTIDEVDVGDTSSLDISPISWHSVPDNHSDLWTILVSSAFYDHRIEKIVILLASDAASLLKRNNTVKYKFYCQLFYFDNNSAKFEIEGYFYTSYIFYCSLPNNSACIPSSNSACIPSSVSIRRSDESDTAVNWTIPIENLLERKNRIKPKKLALCVGILFGYQNWLMILQYIEFHRIHGVEKFIFFYHELHWSTVELFAWYKSRYGFIETVKWDLKHFTCNNIYKCQLLRDNFCSYSLMYKYQFVGNSDFDELFFPVSGSLLELLDAYNSRDRGSFIFQGRYHQILKNDLPQWNETDIDNVSSKVHKFLPLYHFNNVSTLAGSGYSPKTITKPETVLKRWIHYVHVHINGTSNFVFGEKEGFLRHFKIREWWGGWAENADQVVKYKIIDPFIEINRTLINDLSKRIIDVVKNVKSFINETKS